MGYRIIETTTLCGRKRIQWKSTGHNGGYGKRERKKQAAQARLITMKAIEPTKPRHLGRAGTQ